MNKLKFIKKKTLDHVPCINGSFSTDYGEGEAHFVFLLNTNPSGTYLSNARLSVCLTVLMIP